MFVVNEDNSIYATRGDIVFFSVTAAVDEGVTYVFQPGDVVRIKVYGKKDAENVVMQKDFPVFVEAESVAIYLSEEDTKFGGVISKPTDYWYEVELNPYTEPQTIIGYDEDGAKVFRLFPEGDDIPEYVPEPEVIKVIDDELDMTSLRPVQNQAIARAVTKLEGKCTAIVEQATEDRKKASDTASSLGAALSVERARIDSMVSGATADGAEVVDIRVGADGKTYGSAGTAVRAQIAKLSDELQYITEREYDDITGSIVFNTHKLLTINGVTDYDGEAAVCSDAIPVQRSEVYRITSRTEYKNNCIVLFTGADNAAVVEALGVATSPDKVQFDGQIVVVPDGAAYMYVGSWNFDSRKVDIGRLIVKANCLPDYAVNHYTGIKWAVFGDSLTEKNARSKTSYYDYVREELGVEIVNYGRSGSGYGKTRESGRAFYQRMLGVDPASFDVLTIFGSGNDKSSELPIGEITDNGDTTLCGCINTTIDNFYAVAPNKPLGIVTPCPWVNTPPMDTGNWMERYANALVGIARMRGIPCLDLYHCSGMRPWDEAFRNEFYCEDGVQDEGVHPNSKGHKVFLYPHFREFLKTLI